jgi:hypothetical protein
MENPIIVGRTKVRVMRKEEQNGKDVVREAHRGVIVGQTNRFVRVFNPGPRDKGGDVSAQTSELFPLQGRRCWVEIVGELSEDRAIQVPAELRN